MNREVGLLSLTKGTSGADEGPVVGRFGRRRHFSYTRGIQRERGRRTTVDGNSD